MKEQFIQDAENKFGELITNEMTRIENQKSHLARLSFRKSKA